MTSDVSMSCATGSLTHMFPVSASRDSYCTCMCHGDSPRPFLCHAYDFSLMPLTHRRCWRLVLAGLRYAHLSSERFSHRFSLRPVLYPVRFLSITYPTGRYSCLIRLWFLRLFVLVSYSLVYILGWRWDDPHLQSTLQPP